MLSISAAGIGLTLTVSTQTLNPQPPSSLLSTLQPRLAPVETAVLQHFFQHNPVTIHPGLKATVQLEIQFGLGTITAAALSFWLGSVGVLLWGVFGVLGLCGAKTEHQILEPVHNLVLIPLHI